MAGVRQTTLEDVAAMDRGSLIEGILSAEWGFPVDFTPHYLAALDQDKLRHIYAALCQINLDRRH